MRWVSWVVAVVLLATVVEANIGNRKESLQECVCYKQGNATTGVEGGPCTGSLSTQCKTYVKKVAWTMWPVVLAALVFMIVLPVFMCLRKCGVCGTAKASTGLCCGPQSTFEGYGRWEVLLFKGLVVLCACAMGGLVILTILQSADAKRGVIDASNVMYAVADDVDQAADTAVLQVASLSDEIMSASDKMQVNSSSQTARNQVQTLRDDIGKIEKYDSSNTLSRNKVTVGLFVALAVIYLICTVVAVFSITRVLPQIATGLLTTFAFLVCFLVAVYQIAGIVTSDVCDNFDDVTDDLIFRAEGRLGCQPSPDSEDGLYKLVARTNDAKVTLANNICGTGTGSSCRFFDCSGDLCSPASDPETVWGFVNTTSRIIGTPGEQGTCTTDCTIRLCSELCTGNLKAAAEGWVNTVDGSVPALETITNTVFPVANCSILNGFRDDIYHPFCKKVSKPVVDIWGAGYAVLLLSILLSFVMVLLVKRLMPKNHAHSTYRAVETSPTYGHSKPQTTYGYGSV